MPVLFRKLWKLGTGTAVIGGAAIIVTGAIGITVDGVTGITAGIPILATAYGSAIATIAGGSHLKESGISKRTPLGGVSIIGRHRPIFLTTNLAERELRTPPDGHVRSLAQIQYQAAIEFANGGLYEAL